MEEELNIRTDLALEARGNVSEESTAIKGIKVTQERDKDNNITITRLEVLNKSGAEAIGKPVGNYITIEAPDMTMEDDGYHREISIVMAEEEGKGLWTYVGFAKDYIQYIKDGKRINVPFDFGIFRFKNIIIKCDVEKAAFEIYEKGSNKILATVPMSPSKYQPGMSIGDGSGLNYGVVDLSYLGVKFIE